MYFNLVVMVTTKAELLEVKLGHVTLFVNIVGQNIVHVCFNEYFEILLFESLAYYELKLINTKY